MWYKALTCTLSLYTEKYGIKLNYRNSKYALICLDKLWGEKLNYLSENNKLWTKRWNIGKWNFLKQIYISVHHSSSLSKWGRDMHYLFKVLVLKYSSLMFWQKIQKFLAMSVTRKAPPGDSVLNEVKKEG